MLPFGSIVAVLGISLSLFLVTTFKGFDNYHQVENITRSYETSSLASASRVARSASNLIAALSSSLASANATSSTEINNRYQALQNYLSEIDTSVSASPSPVMNTFAKGLSYGSSRSLHKSYTIDLIQSNYLPAQTTSAEPRYAQTLISDTNVAKIISPVQLRSDLDAGSGQLRVSSAMLAKLVTDVSGIISNPSAYGLVIDSRGIDLANLPNGTRVDLQLPLANLALNPSSDKNTTVKLVRKQAAAQIRFSLSTVVVTPRPPQCLAPRIIINGVCSDPQVAEPPTSTTPTGGPCNDLWQWNALTQRCEQPSVELGLTLQAIPYDRIAVVYNPNKTIDSSNPVEIINKKSGGMNSIYAEANGDLQITIGAVPTKANGIAGATTTLPNLDNVSVSATLYPAGEDEKLPSGFAYIGTNNITLDTLPRARTRYGTVTNTFTFNKTTIPAGSIIVAVRKPDLTEVGRPSAKQAEFESYAMYNQKGEYLGKFAAQFGAENHQNLRFDYTPQGKTEVSNIFGEYKVYQQFEVDDLFSALDSKAATIAWLNMQGDMAKRTQFDILSRASGWQKNIFQKLLEGKDLDGVEADDVLYLSNVLSYQGSSEFIKLIYGDIKFVDQNEAGLFDKQNRAMLAYAIAIINKRKIDQGYEVLVDDQQTSDGKQLFVPLTAKQAQKAVDVAKAEFESARNQSIEYQATLTAKAKETNNQNKNNSGGSGNTNSSTDISKNNSNNGGSGGNSNANNNNSNANKNNGNGNANNNNANKNNNNANKNNSGGGGLSGNSTANKTGNKKK